MQNSTVNPTANNKTKPPRYLRLARWLRLWVPLVMLTLAIFVEVVEELQGIHTHFGPGGPHKGFWLEVLVHGLIGPTIVALGFHWVVNIMERLESARASERQLRLKLEELSQARRELLAATIRSQEAERQRVARELHDGIGQPLTAFLLTSTETEKPDPDPALIHARHAASDTLEAMRRLILDLRPSLLDAKGLLPALRQCADKTLAPAGIQVEVSAQGQPQSISGEAETALFRIGQEALTNILRHAQASQASIQLTYTPEQVQLIVQDDGRGFWTNPQDNKTGSLGLGLLSMQERAGQIGGQLDLASQPGQGTQITVSIPVHSSEGKT